MSSSVILVKNMVCHRCVLAVEAILDKDGIPFQKVLFGEIHLLQQLEEDIKEALTNRLKSIGFELIDNQLSGLIEKIKFLVIKKARKEGEIKKDRLNLSNYLSENLHYEYTHLSSLFSSAEGRTIENFSIEQRIEKAKELLIYDQMTLSQIAYELDYSSTAHLSNQFKKITGLTPSYFKAIGAERRKSLDKV